MLIKRTFDLSLLVITSPAWLAVISVLALAVRIKMGRPVFFWQQRAGHHGTPFHVVKFRTMVEEQNESGQLFSDAERLTPFGAWLRSTSMDELPELWNVLRGEMSLVGPRPLHLRYVERYSSKQRRRLEVPPGLTGWAQINGRNSLSWEDRFHLDVWYVDNRSLWLDIKIIWLSIWKVLYREGINTTSEETMPEFMGNPRADNGKDKVVYNS
jgi:lipopolysaccharide/colanic/teichoic acid biosynthesis glycosyltransferase